MPFCIWDYKNNNGKPLQNNDNKIVYCFHPLAKAHQSTDEDADMHHIIGWWSAKIKVRRRRRNCTRRPARTQAHHSSSKQAQAISETDRLPKTHTADRQMPYTRMMNSVHGIRLLQWVIYSAIESKQTTSSYLYTEGENEKHMCDFWKENDGFSL